MSYGHSVNLGAQIEALRVTRPATCPGPDPWVPSSLVKNTNLDLYARNNVDSYRTARDPHRDPNPQIPRNDLVGSSVEPRWSGGLQRRLEFRGTNQFGMMRDIQSKNTTVAPTAPQVPGVPLKDPIENKDIFWSNYNTTAGSGTRKLDASGKTTGLLVNRRGVRTIPASVFHA